MRSYRASSFDVRDVKKSEDKPGNGEETRKSSGVAEVIEWAALAGLLAV